MNKHRLFTLIEPQATKVAKPRQHNRRLCGRGERAAFNPKLPPEAPSFVKQRFTLIELLIVIAVIAILVAMLLLLASRFAATAASSADADSVNVLLITSDDLGLQLSCYGETAIETPHLDALAGRGTRFEVRTISSRASAGYLNGNLGVPRLPR